MKTQRVLPADVYDALEFSALAFGGIGAYHKDTSEGYPVCYIGHLAFTGALAFAPLKGFSAFGIHASDNDRAVTTWTGDILTQRGEDQPRISFEQWCKELNVVRGDQ